MFENPGDTEKVRRWYREQLTEFGDDHRSLGFNHYSSQQRRFHALRRLGDFNGRRLLDMGCGLGDFLIHLLARDIRPDYTGVDLCPEMVDRCRARFPARADLRYRFDVGDALRYGPSGKFDYVVASGIFGLKTDFMRARVAPTLRRLFSWCRRGMAVNFLSSRAVRQAPGRLYMDPVETVSLAQEVTRAALVRLNHEYLPNDFTLYIYRRPPQGRASEMEN